MMGTEPSSLCLLCRDQNPPAALSFPRPRHVPSLTLHPSHSPGSPLSAAHGPSPPSFGQGKWMVGLWWQCLSCPELLCLTGRGGQRWELTAAGRGRVSAVINTMQ